MVDSRGREAETYGGRRLKTTGRRERAKGTRAGKSGKIGTAKDLVS
jgi:hypothetical protein